MPQTNNESEAKIPAKRRKSPRRRWKRALLLLVLMTLLILRVERNVTDVVLTLSQATARSLAIQRSTRQRLRCSDSVCITPT